MHNKNETAALLRAGRQLSLGLAGRSRVLRLFPSALLATEAGLPRLSSPLVRLQPGFRIALRACTHTRNQSPAIVPVAGSGQRKVSLATSFHLPITSRSCPVLDIEFALSLQLELNRFLRVESDPVQHRTSPPDAGTPFRRTPTGYSGNHRRRHGFSCRQVADSFPRVNAVHLTELSFRRMASTGEIKCGGTPCGTSGLRALPGHDRPYIPTSGFSGEALTPLLCGPYGQSQSPNRPDLHGRPVKSHAGEPAVRNRKRRALPPAGRYSFRRVRTVLMRPHCIRRYGPRLSALRLTPTKGTTPSLTRLRNRFGLHVHSPRSSRSPGIEPRSSAPVISGNRIQESHACPGSNLLTPVRSTHA